MHDFSFVLTGFLVGLIIGLTGVGGGSLMTPALIFFGVKPALAVGTDLLFAAATKLSGTLHLARTPLLDWRIVWTLSAGSLPAALLTLYLLHRLGPADAAAQALMSMTLAAALLLTATATFYKAVRNKPASAGVVPLDTSYPAAPRHWSLPLLLGGAVGALVTLSSVGAGAIGASVLLLIYPRLPLSRVVATDIASAVPLTLVAGLGHASLGSVDWRLLVLLLAGSLPGIWLGTRLMPRINERLARTVLSALLAWAGLKFIAI